MSTDHDDTLINVSSIKALRHFFFPQARNDYNTTITMTTLYKVVRVTECSKCLGSLDTFLTTLDARKACTRLLNMWDISPEKFIMLIETLKEEEKEENCPEIIKCLSGLKDFCKKLGYHDLESSIASYQEFQKQRSKNLVDSEGQTKTQEAIEQWNNITKDLTLSESMKLKPLIQCVQDAFYKTIHQTVEVFYAYLRLTEQFYKDRNLLSPIQHVRRKIDSRTVDYEMDIIILGLGDLRRTQTCAQLALINFAVLQYKEAMSMKGKNFIYDPVHKPDDYGYFLHQYNLEKREPNSYSIRQADGQDIATTFYLPYTSICISDVLKANKDRLEYVTLVSHDLTIHLKDSMKPSLNPFKLANPFEKKWLKDLENEYDVMISGPLKDVSLPKNILPDHPDLQKYYNQSMIPTLYVTSFYKKV